MVRLGRRALLAAAAAAAAAAAPIGCLGDGDRVGLRAAGATLPYPLYAHWIARYAAIAPRVRIDYQPVGSAAGVRQLVAGMAELAATDAPFRGAPFDVLHLPTAASAVAIAHRLPGLTRPLRLGPRALSAIFAGEARRWTDPVIAADNPGLDLPDLPVVPVHRSDGSGGTQVLTEWLARRGALAGPARSGMLARFPSGLGGRGSDGVAGIVARVRGAVGYVEVVHARAAGLDVVALASDDVAEGTLPDDAAVARAAAAAARSDALTAPIDVSSSEGYPLTSFTFVVVRRSSDDAPRASALARFLWWTLGPGQEDCARLGYHPLPPAVAARARDALAHDLLDAGRPALRID